MDKNDVSSFAFARLLRVDPKTVIALAAGRQLPTLVLAFKIERATAGAVAASSWLGTELGRMRFNASTFNWTGWLDAKAAATAKHDLTRRTAKKGAARAS